MAKQARLGSKDELARQVNGLGEPKRGEQKTGEGRKGHKRVRRAVRASQDRPGAPRNGRTRQAKLGQATPSELATQASRGRAKD